MGFQITTGGTCARDKRRIGSIIFVTSTKMWLNLNQKYIEKKLEMDYRIKPWQN